MKPDICFFGICPRTSSTPKFWYLYAITTVILWQLSNPDKESAELSQVE